MSVIVTLQISCGRDDPESPVIEPVIQSLQPIAVYTLDIPEPSGIAYNSQTNTLWIVSDAKSEIFEIDFNGEIVSELLTASTDLEGISFSKNCDTTYVVEEKNQMVTSYSKSGIKLSSFSVNVATNPKHALEGVACNIQKGTLIVLNEKLPCMLLEYKNSAEVLRKEINYTSDISDVYIDYISNQLWIVSDEAKKILLLSSDFSLVSEWTIPVLQAEGITIVGNKIYVVSDIEGKMYVFQKPA